MRHQSWHCEHTQKKTAPKSQTDPGEMRLKLFCFQLKSCYLDGCAASFFFSVKVKLFKLNKFRNFTWSCRIVNMNIESFNISSQNPVWISNWNNLYKKKIIKTIDKCEIILQFSHFFSFFPVFTFTWMSLFVCAHEIN